METNLFAQNELGTSEITYYANVEGTIIRISKKEYETAEALASTLKNVKYIKYVKANTFEIGFND